ncbi:hypothetical protein [Streptomyces sp. SID12488]|uniref:hypothetical protein n=1 Tax=Streptomyces sp. SID12488 TaxID=2706040 RepID=UPI0013D8F811|nr:hypothetical protein [Streptomyces sp. SID12488]NEA62239.1 hypothetical protein [Streptomyces sp. SID12488]
MEVVSHVIGFALAAVLVGGGVLQLLGRRMQAGLPESRRRRGAWSNILFGVAIALFTAARIPRSHRLLWDDLLLGPAFVCVLVAALVYGGPWRTDR